MKKFLIGIWSYPLQWILYFFTYILIGVNFITGWIFRIGAIVAFIVDLVNLCNGTHNFGIFCAWFALILFIFLIPWLLGFVTEGGAALIENISDWRSSLFEVFDEKKRAKKFKKMDEEKAQREAQMTEEEKAEQRRIEREQVNNTMRQLKQVAKEYEQKEREAQRR